MDPERPTGTCVVMVTHKGEPDACSPTQAPTRRCPPTTCRTTCSCPALTCTSPGTRCCRRERGRPGWRRSTIPAGPTPTASVDRASAAPLERAEAEPFLELSAEAVLLFVQRGPSRRCSAGRDDPEQAAARADRLVPARRGQARRGRMRCSTPTDGRRSGYPRRLRTA